MKIVMIIIACICALAIILGLSFFLFGPQLLAAAGRYHPPLPPPIHEELNWIQWNNLLLREQIAHTKSILWANSTDLLDIRREYTALQSEMKLLIQQVEDEMDSETLRNNSLRTQLNTVKEQSKKTLADVQVQNKLSKAETMSNLDHLVSNILHFIENREQDWHEYRAHEDERLRKVKEFLDRMQLPDWDDIRPSF